MPPLHDALRRELEKTVIKARDVAEAGARAALARLTVGDREPGAHLGADDRVLRNRLRAHARQLGDRRNERTGEQETDRLTQEVAYEAWHRMLFARFLAENRLLIHPEMQVPVSLEECEELATEEGIGDGWVLASRYAARMLPEIFRPDDPVLQVPFAPEHQQELERLVAERNLPHETFLADDALGWVYQFWQTRRKDEVNASGEKISGDTLPAVTQLFTEPYMVSFLLENTIGAWWAGRNTGKEPPVAMPYLRKMEDGSPASGTLESWPSTWRELTILDPCCGSGHFLVAALKLIVPLRMRDEGLSVRDAVDAVLRENLHGLELDARCAQIAAFALALTAWTFPDSGGYRKLPELQVACSGTPVGGRKEDWTGLARGDGRLETALGYLYEQFRDAAELGSLIAPERASSEDLLTAHFDSVRPLLVEALSREKATRTEAQEATVVAAQGVARAAQLLAARYVLVATNVPYLTRRKQSEILRRFCEEHYPRAKNDLATVFVERGLRLVRDGGTVAVVSPQNWLFLSTYEDLRRGLLTTARWGCIALLGAGAFQTPMWDFNVMLCVLSASGPSPSTTISCVVASDGRDHLEKASRLRSSPGIRISQNAQVANPDARVVIGEAVTGALLQEYASNHAGLQTGDNPRFRRYFWEVPTLGPRWALEQSSVSRTNLYGGLEGIVLWDDGRGELRAFGEAMIAQLHNVDRRGQEAWGRRGVGISQMNTLPAALYTGEKFDSNVAVLIPRDPAHLPAIWAFCSSEEYAAAVRRIDQKLNVTNATLTKVPFDLGRWQGVARELYPNGLPEPSSQDLTQWAFDGSISRADEPLHVAVPRLLGYRWLKPGSDESLAELEDADGIVCLPAVRGEQGAAERLALLLAKGFGADWSPTRLTALLRADGDAATLEKWLRDSFFEQHCKRFYQRPFIWHVWDGRKDGFSALLNYHKLDHRTLESLTYTYLGDWIARQEEGAARNQSGAEARLVAARDLQDKLKLILAGEPPYDIFVRWKPLHAQPIGWDPDIDDGVRVNIWPFVKAGILRKTPNIKWGRDRGNDLSTSPWGEERWNRYENIPRAQRPEYLRDVDELTTELKRRARGAHARGLPLARLHEVSAS